MIRPGTLCQSLAILMILSAATPTWAGDDCVPGPNTLCLDGFSAEVTWEDPLMNTGNGQVMPIAGTNFGFFTFEDDRYVELFVQVLNGCGFNNRYWVFGAGLSSYLQTLTITDVSADVAMPYDNPAGVFLNLRDTDAFATCGPLNVSPEKSAETQALGPPSVLSLIDDRFDIEISWMDLGGNTGSGQPVALTSHSGYFWLFTPDSPDVIVKIVDGSATNGFFQLFFGGTTNVELTVQFTDRCTGAIRTYFNPLGTALNTVADTSAFPAASPCPLFSDTFESGDTSAWTTTVSAP